MTNHSPEQAKHNGYNPITLEDVQPNPPDPFFANLDTPGSRIVGAALFLFIFSMSKNTPVAAPLLMLVLLACLLLRMNPRERALTAVPLTFSAVRLGSEFAGPVGIWQHGMPVAPSPLARQFDAGTVWLPLFLAAYLFFTSTIDTHTGRVVFWVSLAVLLSGLLPGEGYLVIFAMLYYTLFFVILVSIILDLSARADTARPLGPRSQPVRA
jgi:hypothetical protein